MDTASFARFLVAATIAITVLENTIGSFLEWLDIPYASSEVQSEGFHFLDTTESSDNVVDIAIAALSAAAHSASVAGLLLSVSQIVALVIIASFGVKIGWYRGLPIKPEFVTPKGDERQGVLAVNRARFVFICVSLGVGVFLAMQAFKIGILTGILSSALLIVLFLYPVVASLPLWFWQTIVGVEPLELLRGIQMPTADSLGLSHLWSRSRLDAEQNTREEDARPRAERTGPDASSRTRSHKSEEPGAATVPVSADHQARYTAACRTFGLEPNGFSEGELRTKYRERMRQISQGQPGAELIQKIVNTDYEFILIHHVWQR